MLSRRRFLTSIAAFCGAAAIPSLGLATSSRPGSRLDQLVPLIDPSLEIHNAHTDERIRVRFHTPTGYDMSAVVRLNAIMRDWRENEVVQMDVRLFWGLAAIRQASMKDGHSGEITLLSGYRTEKTNALLRSKGYGAARNSLHLRGKANDFILEGARVSDIARYAEWLQVGGIGYYRRSAFVHMDSGTVRRWNS
jgi:uncharacterized protein YcbK (DUF882 family)